MAARANDDGRRIADLRRTRQELDLELVRAAAGDPCGPEVKEDLARERVNRQGKMHAELVFALSHRRFSEDAARKLWDEILENRRALTAALGRDPGLVVAALDHMLAAGLLRNPVVIEEQTLLDMAGHAVLDGLTGLMDQASFRSRLRSEMARTRRYGTPLSLIMIDIDHFKDYNDAHGHPAGDEILRRLAELLQNSCRESDVAARYGGEEFALLAPNLDKTSGMELAERIRLLVSEQFLQDDRLTVSLGLATAPQDAETPEDFIQAADQALYASKQSGRNQSTPFEQDLLSEHG
jgi:diguanylate cyclase (GGDEF)-like protein